ncbi:ras gtpase-activating protein [Anaeramoeba flamelloides]|uniref:Ras gtpase-activating protein n=1 Tax=Anaeramoeba flamelloides TaxID=1746091 RepID=A0ABQ8XYU1_9EUKA|nr:ras gtpase-activating protein [Anaeramoeba flamelloides]
MTEELKNTFSKEIDAFLNHSEISVLKENEKEDLKKDPFSALLKWVNYQIKQSSTEVVVTNFEQDFQSCTAFVYLLQTLDSTKPYLSVLKEEGNFERSTKILEYLKETTYHLPKTITAQMLSENKLETNISFTLSLFRWKPNLPISHKNNENENEKEKEKKNSLQNLSTQEQEQVELLLSKYQNIENENGNENEQINLNSVLGKYSNKEKDPIKLNNEITKLIKKNKKHQNLVRPIAKRGRRIDLQNPKQLKQIKNRNNPLQGKAKTSTTHLERMLNRRKQQPLKLESINEEKPNKILKQQCLQLASTTINLELSRDQIKQINHTVNNLLMQVKQIHKKSFDQLLRQQGLSMIKFEQLDEISNTYLKDSIELKDNELSEKKKLDIEKLVNKLNKKYQKKMILNENQKEKVKEKEDKEQDGDGDQNEKLKEKEELIEDEGLYDFDESIHLKTELLRKKFKNSIKENNIFNFYELEKIFQKSNNDKKDIFSSIKKEKIDTKTKEFQEETLKIQNEIEEILGSLDKVFLQFESHNIEETDSSVTFEESILKRVLEGRGIELAKRETVDEEESQQLHKSSLGKGTTGIEERINTNLIDKEIENNDEDLKNSNNSTLEKERDLNYNKNEKSTIDDQNKNKTKKKGYLPNSELISKKKLIRRNNNNNKFNFFPEMRHGKKKISSLKEKLKLIEEQKQEFKVKRQILLQRKKELNKIKTNNNVQSNKSNLQAKKLPIIEIEELKDHQIQLIDLYINNNYEILTRINILFQNIINTFKQIFLLLPNCLLLVNEKDKQGVKTKPKTTTDLIANKKQDGETNNDNKEKKNEENQQGQNGNNKENGNGNVNGNGNGNGNGKGKTIKIPFQILDGIKSINKLQTPYLIDELGPENLHYSIMDILRSNGFVQGGNLPQEVVEEIREEVFHLGNTFNTNYLNALTNILNIFQSKLQIESDNSGPILIVSTLFDSFSYYKYLVREIIQNLINSLIKKNFISSALEKKKLLYFLLFSNLIKQLNLIVGASINENHLKRILQKIFKVLPFAQPKAECNKIFQMSKITAFGKVIKFIINRIFSNKSKEKVEGLLKAIDKDPVSIKCFQRSKQLMKGYLSHRDLQLLTIILDNKVSSNYINSLSISLFIVSEYLNCTLPLIKLAITLQIMKSKSPINLFRSIDFAAKLVALYCRKHGSDYLHDTLKDIIQEIDQSNLQFEVDTFEVTNKEERRKNKKNLRLYFEKLLNRIFNSINQIPIGIKIIASHIKKEVKTHFGENELIPIASFFILRFICPVLVSPKEFGVISKETTSKGGRTLLLLSSLTQNMATDVKFGENRQYLQAFNKDIEKMKEKRLKFLEQISNFNYQSKPSSSNSLKNSDFINYDDDDDDYDDDEFGNDNSDSFKTANQQLTGKITVNNAYLLLQPGFDEEIPKIIDEIKSILYLIIKIPNKIRRGIETKETIRIEILFWKLQHHKELISQMNLNFLKIREFIIEGINDHTSNNNNNTNNNNDNNKNKNIKNSIINPNTKRQLTKSSTQSSLPPDSSNNSFALTKTSSNININANNNSSQNNPLIKNSKFNTRERRKSLKQKIKSVDIKKFTSEGLTNSKKADLLSSPTKNKKILRKMSKRKLKKIELEKTKESETLRAKQMSVRWKEKMNTKSSKSNPGFVKNEKGKWQSCHFILKSNWLAIFPSKPDNKFALPQDVIEISSNSIISDETTKSKKLFSFSILEKTSIIRNYQIGFDSVHISHRWLRILKQLTN